jgi:hypothetical protein
MNDDVIILEQVSAGYHRKECKYQSNAALHQFPGMSVRAFGEFMSAFQDISVTLSVSSCP